MQKILAMFVLSIGLAAPAAASEVLPPGYAWYACSAPHDCAGPAYVRKLTVARKHVVVRHRPARAYKAVAPRKPKVAVHRKAKIGAYHKVRRHGVASGAYVFDGPYQVIYDRRFAAVAAWADIVNSERYYRR